MLKSPTIDPTFEDGSRRLQSIPSNGNMKARKANLDNRYFHLVSTLDACISLNNSFADGLIYHAGRLRNQNNIPSTLARVKHPVNDFRPVRRIPFTGIQPWASFINQKKPGNIFPANIFYRLPADPDGLEITEGRASRENFDKGIRELGRRSKAGWSRINRKICNNPPTLPQIVQGDSGSKGRFTGTGLTVKNSGSHFRI